MTTQLCSLQKDPNRPGEYTSESVDQLLGILTLHIEDGMKYSKDGLNMPLLRAYISKALYTIGNTYVNTLIGPITRIIEDFFDLYMEGELKILLPELNLYNVISKSRREALGNKEIDLDYFLGTDKEKNTSFIDNVFGVLTDIKNKFKQETMYRLINTFAINRKEGYLIPTILDANIEARKTKEALYQNIKEFLNDDRLEELLFDGDVYTGALENEVFKHKILQISSRLNPENIEDVYNDMHRGGDTKDDINRRETNSKLYLVMMDYFTLINFDNLTNLLMGELITVNPTTFNQFTNGDVYRYTTKAQHLITSWGQDGRSLELDISKFILALINTTPYYRYGQDTVDTGLFITFEDFYRTINLVKNLVWDRRSSEFIFTGLGVQKHFYDKLDLADASLINGKSLRWLINQIRENPLKYTRIVMLALNDKDMRIYNHMGIKQLDRDYCYSIFKGFFDPDHKESIRAILKKGDYKLKQYYQAVTQAVDSMFDVKFMQYYQNDDGSIVARPHSAQTRDLARHTIETSIHRGNSRRKNFYFTERELKPFNAKPTYKQEGTENKLLGISYEITLDDGLILTVLLNNLGENIAFFINGNMVVDPSIYWNNKSVNAFINQLLKFDLNLDHAYRDAIEGVMGNKAFENLMTLSSIVLFNKYISSVEMADIMGPKKTTLKLTEIYKESLYKPLFDYTYNEMKLFPQIQFVFDVLDDLSDARTIVTGEVNTTMVRDAEGNALPTLTSSRLFGAIQSQWELLRDTNSPAAGFSLLKPGLVKAIYSAKELVSSAGNKDYSKFTVAESIQANFLYDFVAGFVESKDVAGRKIIGNGSVGLLTSVNSDKGTYAKVVLDLKNSVDGINTWESIPTDLLIDTAMTELYDYYNGMTKAVARDYILLGRYLNNPSRNGKHQGITIDYWDNFKSFNKYCKSIGENAVTVLYDITKEYNSSFPHDPIMLIDLTHFVKCDKKGTEIKRNNNVRDSLRRFSDKERFTKFLKIKELDILKALLDEEVMFDLFENNVTSVTPKSWLKAKYPDWVGKPGVNNEKMVLAKVNINGQVFNIINKIDLEVLQNLLGKDFSKNLHDLREFDVLLHPMLLRFNLFDFLFSQEFLLSSVGSHTNHPIKGESDVPIIWNDLQHLYTTESSTTFSTALNNDYPSRTRTNAAESDITLSIATDFSTLGEKLTARASGSRDPKYLDGKAPEGSIDKHVPVEYGTNTDVMVKTILKYIKDKNLPTQNIVLNIAGNGIYSFKDGTTLDLLNDLLTDIITKLLENGITIKTIRSGGQTGIDEAGIIAAQRLGIPSIVHSTNNYAFRVSSEIFNSKYKALLNPGEYKPIYGNYDIINRPDLFKARFNNQDTLGKEIDYLNNDDIMIFDPDPAFYDDDQIVALWEDYKVAAKRENKILMTSYPLIYDVENNFTYKITDSKLGDIIEKALNQILDNEIGEEAARFLAQHKRNVSLTATMYPFQRHQIDGPPTVYNMAILSDIFYDVYTLNGDITDWAPFDGATYVNPFAVYWENSALDENKAGIDKKPFVHGYDVNTGTGIIIKTAGFGLTNDRIKSHKFYRILMKNMTDLPWTNPDNTTHIVREGGILVDYNGESVDYGKFYFKKNGQYIMREIISYRGNNEYEIEDTVVDESGVPTGESVSDVISNVNSNYRVWQMFGAENSLELDYRGLLVPSEDSIQKTVRASIAYGIKKPGVSEIDSAEDIYLPMKHSDIHWAPTVGAIKLGPANINPNDCYYKEFKLNHMTVDMRLAGIQLDKEHQADNSTLSLMTLVVAGAAAKGYTLDKSTALYLSLYDLTKVKTREFRDALGNITTDSDKFDAAASHIILQAIMNSQATDGELIRIIANDLIQAMKDTKEFKLTKEFAEKIDNEIPYSNRGVYNKIVTILNSTLTKLGIKQEVSGTLSVLNPTLDVIKLYKVPLLNADGLVVVDKNNKIVYRTVNYGLLLDYANLAGISIQDSDNIGEIEDLILLFLLDNYAEVVYLLGVSGSIANVDIGKNYVVTAWAEDEETGERSLHSYNVFLGFPNAVKKDLKLKNGLNVWGYKDLRDMEANIVSITDYVKEGNDLDAYTVRFSDGVNTYQSADLDILQDFFNLKAIKDPREQYLQGLVYLAEYGKVETFINLVRRDLQQLLLRNVERMKAEDANKNAINIERIGKTLQALETMLDSQNITLLYDSVNDNVKKYLTTTILKVLNRLLQLALNAISPTDLKIDKVKINNNWVNIDKSSIKVTAYGAVMPKTFKSSLGLEQHDDLETIKHDPDFFIKRLLRHYGTKVSNFVDYDETGTEVYINNYHLELKRTNGKHLYIRQGLNDSRFSEKVEIFTLTDDNGRVFRVDDHNRIMYELSSINDEIYRDYDGNEIIVTQPDKTIWRDSKGNELVVIKDKKGNLMTDKGHEIVKTGDVYYDTNAGEVVTKTVISGLLFYIDTMEYNSFYINKGITDGHFSDILSKTINSTNTTANKLGELILSLGKREKKLTDSIKKLRELSDAMNDYEALYKEYENNKDLPLSEQKHSKAYHAIKYLVKTGREMHTSFLKTLNIVAARIPAQNQQSFMAMKVQAYDNPDINSAYVSTYQFFLQGSDLDIDAVSLQTFTLNKGGLFVGHSPYYNLLTEDLQKESEKIPFPTGKNVEVTEENSTFKKYLEYITIKKDGIFEDAFDVDDSFLLILEGDLPSILDGGFLTIDFRKNEEVKVSLDLNTPAKMRNFINFLKEEKFGIGDILGTIDEFAKNTIDSNITEELLLSINELLIAIINKHNHYITKSSFSKLEAIARNYLTLQTYDIILDPINQLLALSSVDIVTSPFKKIAATSEKASVLKTFSTGNVVNKHQSISENGVGRDDIAICATDLKGFFALTLLYNMVLSGTDKEAKDKLINKIIHIGGKDYKGLANAFTNTFATGEIEYGALTEEELIQQEALFSEKVKDYLIEQYFAMDASNNKSGSLSLSTDNAKELVLDKINAGTATMGMYLYGMSLGIPFETLYKIIASPFGRRITALTKGDMFNGNRGTIDVIGALDYIYLEPTLLLAAFDGKLDTSEIPTNLLPSLIMGIDVRAKITKAFFEGKEIHKNAQKARLYVYDYIESFRKNIANNITVLTLSKVDADVLKSYETVANQAIDFILSYANDVMSTLDGTFYETEYGSSSITKDFELLAMGAAETKLLGRNLRINQGINTDPNESIDLVDNMQNLIVNRISLLRRYKLRHGDLNPFTANLTADELSIFNRLTDSKYYDYKILELIDIELFILDPRYAENAIKKYDIIKATYNGLLVLNTVQHYKGYLETLYTSYASNKNKSAKYRYIAEQKKLYENKYNIRDPKLKELLGKNIEDAIDTFFRQEWMKERYSKKKPTMPASTDERTVIAFIDGVRVPKPIIYQKELLLGTDLGDANYKLWFEEVILPDMKKLYPNNKFIQSLDWITNPKTQAGAIASSIGLRNISMLPKSPYEVEKFNEIKKHFNDLKKEKELYKDAKGNLWNPQELLYIYSLITTNGKLSPTSLHGIFEDYLLSEPARSFHKKIAEYDLSKEKLEGIYIKKYGLLVKSISDDNIAPFSSPYSGGSDLFRSLDRETEEISIWEKATPEMIEENEALPPLERISIINGYYKRNAYTVGLNTDYFLSGTKVSAIEGITTLAVKENSELSKYNIVIEKIGKNKVGLVEIKAKDKKDLETANLLFDFIRDNNKGLLPTRISKDATTAEDLIDVDMLEMYLNSMKCLNA